MLPMPVETVVERIRRLVSLAVRSGKFANEAEFLRTIGRSDGYFGELASRTSENPSATVRGDTAAKIAEALGVSVAEVLGAPAHNEPPLVDVYPNRAWAVAAARNLDLPEAAIQVVLKQDPGRDLHKLAWFKRMEAAMEDLRPASEPIR